MKTVVCVGDSITKGQLGENYVKLLQKQFGTVFNFINHGINGDLAYNVLKRLDKIVSLKPDYITLLIGTNDVLATYSKFNTDSYIKIKKLPNYPTEDWYAENLKNIVLKLQEKTKARIWLLSLPLVTEMEQNILFQRSIEYSWIIRKAADAAGVGYIGVNERQLDIYSLSGSHCNIDYQEIPHLSAKAALQHYILLKSWDDISNKYGFLLTIDHIHQNSKGATMIKDCISEVLLF